MNLINISCYRHVVVVIHKLSQQKLHIYFQRYSFSSTRHYRT